MIYRLRWYFEYLARADYYGAWSSVHEQRPAWCHNYEGILRAMIQGKDKNGKIIVLAECPGQDFMNFQFIANSKLSGSISPGKVKINQGKMPARIVGIKMQTRYGQISVYEDGSVTNDKKVYDKINFRTYGR